MMKKKFINIRKSISNYILHRNLGSILFFILCSLSIYIFLFSTVHKNQIDKFPQKVYPGDKLVIMQWIEQGYFNLCGLRFYESIENNPKQYVKGNYGMAYLVPAFIIQKIFFYFNGTYNASLTCYYNQVIIMISAMMIGFLAYKLAIILGLSNFYGFLLGISSLSVFQTFPWNLYQYWRLYPTAVYCMFVIAFLILFLKELGCGNLPKWFFYLKAIILFLIFYIDVFGGFFLVLVYFFTMLIMSHGFISKHYPLETIIIPALLAIILFAGTIIYAKLKFPEISLSGSSFLYRTGFDGSIEYYLNHWDLFSRNSYSPVHIGNAAKPLYNWKFLFITGSLSVICLFYFSVINPFFRKATQLILVALGVYIPFAFMFSQAAITHPFGYDYYFIIPLILCFFVILPAILGYYTKYPEFFVLISFSISFCYSMIQLRNYAVCFPN